MKRLIISIIFIAGIFSLTYSQQASKAQNDNWVKIGQTTVNLSEDHGIFDWDRDREETINANDKYSMIKFRAKDSKVNLSNVEVEYDNGKKEKLNITSAIGSNSESKEFKLDTRADLDKIHFSFMKDESAAADKATIEVWGLKAGASGMGQRGTDVDVDIDKNRNRNRDTEIDVDVDRKKNRDVDVDVDKRDK